MFFKNGQSANIDSQGLLLNLITFIMTSGLLKQRLEVLMEKMVERQF